MAQIEERAIHDAGTPTEAAPETGHIVLNEVWLSEVEHWVSEDGLHVFRSLEFDCLGEAEDEYEAGRVFVDNATDLFHFLDDLVDARRATTDEIRTMARLSRRLIEALEVALKWEEEKPRRKLRLPLSREPTHSYWQRQTTPSSSSQPLPV
jgi:hypothetical protein